MEQNLFGQILLNLNLINEDQLEQVLQAQQRGDRRPLGELLQEYAHLDEKTINTILSIQTRRRRAKAPDEKSGEPDYRERLKAGDIHEFVRVAKDFGASELYIGAGESPALRIHGNLVDLDLGELSADRARSLLFSLLEESDLEEYYEKKNFSRRLSSSDVGRFTINLFQHFRGDCGIFRLIPDQIWPFERLGLPDAVRDLALRSNGLILVTGPSRCGKSTTLNALVDYVNQNERRHIISIEESQEVFHESRLSLITHREVGTHTRSYSSALRAALREDPDVLVIGDLHDAETVATAVTAAETGHLVIGTLHTKNTYRTVVRIIDQFPPQKRSHARSILAGVLRGIVSQDLVPNLDGQGCSLAYEVLIANSAVSHLIREDRIWQIPMTMQMGASEGMVLMDDVLLALYKKGKISLEEAVIRATEREKFIHLQELPSPAVTSGGSSRMGRG